jgi:phage/conjugal plasmid C-4 type zinc finger TraR family protein
MTKKLPAKDRNAILAALEEQRASLLNALKASALESGNTQFSEILGRGSGDSGDEALAVTLGDLAAARMDHEVRALTALDAARKRMDQADFGLCGDCGGPIPVARLVANPAATRCVDCQEHHERTHAGQPHGSL